MHMLEVLGILLQMVRKIDKSTSFLFFKKRDFLVEIFAIDRKSMEKESFLQRQTDAL